MEWGFHYAGPYEASPDMKCASCLASSTKECPTHARSFTLECAHCKSAQGAPCQGHWGLSAALDEYETRLTGQDKEDFSEAKKIILAEPAHPTKKKITVSARSNGVLAADGYREFFVSMHARP